MMMSNQSLIDRLTVAADDMTIDRETTPMNLPALIREARAYIVARNACIAELEQALEESGARINVLVANESRLIDKIAAMLAALRKAVVVLAGVCKHAPEIGADEAYEAVSAAIEKATKP